MGKGSIANLASAAVVAASSFTMTVTDPGPLLSQVDKTRFDQLREWVPKAANCHSEEQAAPAQFTVSEPAPVLAASGAGASAAADEETGAADAWSHLPERLEGRVQRFGDAVDTDAIIPAVFMGCSPADMVKVG